MTKVIYIDHQNLIKRFREANKEIKMDAFYKYLRSRTNADSIKVFVGYIAKFEEEYQAWREIGYDVCFADNPIRLRVPKGNVDTDLVIEAMKNYYDPTAGVARLSKAWLISNDNDYSGLIRFWGWKDILGGLYVPDIDQAGKILLSAVNDYKGRPVNLMVIKKFI